MISVTDLRAGTAFLDKGKPFQVLEYKHTKLGRGGANVRVKVRDLGDGGVVTKTYTSGVKVEPVTTESKELQFLYREKNDYYFMDPRNFEQISLSDAVLGGQEKFLQEGQKVKVLFWEEKPLTVELPATVILKVVQAPPGARGDTANASYKPVTVANGLVVRAPLFIKIGDKIKIDTRTGGYVARVK